MNVRTTLLTTAVLLAGVAAIGLPRSEATQPPQTIPQSLRLEHQEIIRQITALAEQPAPVGPEARKLLDLRWPPSLGQESGSAKRDSRQLQTPRPCPGSREAA
jgi:hypothetical protein